MTINTTLNVTLSPTLLSAHSVNPDGLLGVSASAFGVYFDGDGTAHWQKYVLAGSTSSLGPQTPFTWTSTAKSEKVYFIIESGSVDFTLGTVITQESDISWSHARANNYRFDSFELSLTGNPADQGNLTSVNYFGIPMEVSIPGVGTRGYNINGNTLFTDIAGSTPPAEDTYAGGGLIGQLRMVPGPTESVSGSHVSPKPYLATDWTSYVTALENYVIVPAGQPAKVAISGWFNGAADANNVWHNAGFYSYGLSHDGTNFWLSPTANSQIKGDIKISPTELTKSIYSTLGSVDIYTHKSDANAFMSGMNTGANNEWGTVLRDLVTGFTGGYYGGSGNQNVLNSQLSGIVDLNKTWNWDPTFAFNDQGTNTLTGSFTGTNNKYDPYAKVFFDNTNSYGAGYSDNLMKAYAEGGPLISLYSGGSNVSAINITLYADSDTPSGYETPVIYNKPDPGGFAAPTQFVGDGLNIVLSFINAQAMLKDGTPIRIAWYSGDTSGNFDNYVDIPTTGTIFQNWNIQADSSKAGGYEAVAYAPHVLTPGSILLNQLPAVESGGQAWYQITVGQGTAFAKTFNLYSTTTGTGPATQFVNPAQTPSAVQIDGLANITATPGAPTVGTYTVNFLGTSYAIDPSLLQRVTNPGIIDDAQNASFPTPQAPVVGSLDADGTFHQLAPPGANDPTVGSLELAFGWNGADSTKGNDVSKFTNKVAALDWVKVEFTASSGPPPTPIHAQAKVDGSWVVTDTQQFSNGIHYSATFKEYAATDTGLTTRLAKVSDGLEFQVNAATLPFGVSPDGDGLVLSPNGSGTPGNWIKLEATGSTLPNGTLLVYATDSEGNLIGRDGKVGVSLDDAVLARIGLVAADDGTTLFSGAQSVYLKVGTEMHFAVLTGDGKIQQTPGLSVDATDTLSVSVNGTFGNLHLKASVDNTLSHDAMLAGSQRQYDEPWVYLSDDANTLVEISGSAANVNTVHFVKFDVNAATGGWSVDGVAYGNTDAFRNAVEANWDAGFAVQDGGGTFHAATAWHVSGGTGFYAPVLQTQDGDVFVIGTDNIDGREHIRMYGQNIFGFEDLRADQGSDFDYNDMIMKVHWDGL